MLIFTSFSFFTTMNDYREKGFITAESFITASYGNIWSMSRNKSILQVRYL